MKAAPAPGVIAFAVPDRVKGQIRKIESRRIMCLILRLGLIIFFAAAAITKKSFAPAATSSHTVTMLSRCNQNLPTTGSRARPVRVRRYIAGLMALVVFAASFALAAREPALAMSANGRAVAEMTTSGKYLPKPCQKIVLPGTVNTCPLSSFSFNFVPSVGANTAGPTLVAAVQWQMSNSSLAAQCCGFSPYRPPCSKA